MMKVFWGADGSKARAALRKAAAAAGLPLVRISDASPLVDLQAALGAGGMFAQKRTVILDRISDNPELWEAFLEFLPRYKKEGAETVPDTVLVLEERVDAAAKRLLQKYADKMETFDAPKKEKEKNDIFALASLLRAGDKKRLWIAYQRELAGGRAPEAIHGVLFWGAKQMVLKARAGSTEPARARALVAELAELPHEARRRGEELEYALERFILSRV